MAISEKISAAFRGGRAQAFLSDGINDVVLDVVLSFEESDEFDVTQHTIEGGIDITDHIDAKPRTFEISAILTDDDYDLLDPEGFFDKTIEDRFDLLNTWKEYKPVLIYYGHETDVEDVVITNITKTKDDEIGAGYRVDISLTEIKVAEISTVTLETSLSGVNKKGATAKGTTSKKGTPKASKNQSLAKGALGNIGVF